MAFLGVTFNEIQTLLRNRRKPGTQLQLQTQLQTQTQILN